MPYSLIGIDIGTYLTKIVEIKPGRQPVLMNTFTFTTPYFKEKETRKSIDEEETLNLIVNKIGLSKLKESLIGIILPSSFIRAEVFSLPQMSIQELNLAAINEAKRGMIPILSPEKAIFDYVLLGKKVVEDIPQLEVLVTRTEKEVIDEKVELFEKWGVLPNLITATPFATVNLLPEDFWKTGENVTFINIGASTVDIFIARERKVRFFRNIAFGVNEIISSVSQVMEISREEASKRLREYGVPSLSDFGAKDRVAIAEEIMRQKYEAAAQGRKIDREVILLELKTALQPHVDRVVTELRRSFIYYREQEKRAGGIEKVLFSGGGSQIKNLVTEITKQIGGACSILEPFQYVKPLRKREIPEEILFQGPSFSPVCGLALTLGVKEKERINFLPLSMKKRKKVGIIRMSIMLAAGFLFFLFLVGYLNLLFTARSLKLSLLEQRARIEGLAPMIDQELRFRNLSKKIRGILTTIDSLEKQSMAWDQILIQLARQVPEEMTLSSLYFQKKKDQPSQWELKLSGFIIADYETAYRILENFKDSLRNSGHFKNISSSTLELEPVTPLAVEGEKVVLTEIKEREFSLTADLEKLTLK